MNGSATLRLDKWLWHARFAKTRTLAQKLVAGGGVRVNKAPVKAPSHGVRPGDVLTIAVERTVRVVRLVDLGTRRGPATEARLLYEDLAPPHENASSLPAPDGRRDAGAGRPTKRERREIISWKGQDPSGEDPSGE